jgi:hypothetical protein
MSVYKMEVVKGAIVVFLVAVLSIANYLLFPAGLLQVIYGVGVTVQDDGLAARDFMNETISAGGGFTSIVYFPKVYLVFGNESEVGYLYDSIEQPWINEVTVVNASSLREITVDFGLLDIYSENSRELDALNFSWDGSYSKGHRIQSILRIGNETTDLGTWFQDNVVFNHTLGNIEFQGHPPIVEWETGLCWGQGSKYHGWAIKSSRSDAYAPPGLLQLAGQSESISILFEGSVWVNGNYTLTVSGVEEQQTVNVTESVSFGRIDVSFKDGEIDSLHYLFNRIDLIFFVNPGR